MDRLQAMQVFVRVVDSNSFTKAADTLNLPRPSVTNIIQNLERFLKTRLLQRTTRRLRLTSAGVTYYEACVQILAQIDEIEAPFVEGGMSPRGKLRIDTSGPIAKMVIIPALDDFHSKFPDIQLSLGISDKRLDLVEEGIDCAIRIGVLPDSSLIARSVGVMHSLTAASPGYIQRYGIPDQLADLSSHVAARYVSGRTGRPVEVHFVIDGERVDVEMPQVMSVNDAEALLAVGLRGLGLIQVARMLAIPHIESGELVELLPEWRPTRMPISIVYPQSRQQSSALRAFIEWMTELCLDHPLLVDGTEMESSVRAWA